MDSRTGILSWKRNVAIPVGLAIAGAKQLAAQEDSVELNDDRVHRMKIFCEMLYDLDLFYQIRAYLTNKHSLDETLVDTALNMIFEQRGIDLSPLLDLLPN